MVMKYPSSQFFLQTEKGGEKEKYYFVHQSGHRVETDALGAAIWASLPGWEEKIRDKLVQKMAVEADLIEDFLEVMTQAELILEQPEGKESKVYLEKENKREKQAAEAVKDEAERITSRLEEMGRKPRAGGNGAIGPSVESREERISVVVVTHNSEENIAACLRSLKEQTFPPAEVVVVDNASRDRTREIITYHFPEVRLIALKKNIYFPAAVNLGIDSTRGDFILVLNDDVELSADCLFQLIERMKEESHAAAISPLMKFYYLRGFINGLGNHIREKGWGSDNFIGLVDCGQFRQVREIPAACFGAVFLRRAAVNEVGLLDNRYQSFYEDVDWSFRAWLAGWKVVAAPEAVVYHKFGFHWQDSPRKLRLVVRNRLRLVLKMFTGKELALFLQNYLSEDFKNFFSLLRQKKWKWLFSYVLAYFNLFFQLPDIFVKRKAILAERAGLQETCLKETGLFTQELNEVNTELNLDSRIKDEEKELGPFRQEKRGVIFKRKRMKPFLEVEKKGRVDVSFILKKNPEFFSGLNAANQPVLDTSIIERYYRRCLRP